MTSEKKLEKQEQMKDILERLEAGVQEVFTSDNYIRLLDIISKFHNYSLNNCILILMQCPEATRVASFATWKKIGHPVVKGSKGIKILVPIPYKYQKKEKSLDADGNEVSEIVDAQGLTFRIGHVFDASQVNGELPTLTHELTDDSPHLQKAVDRIIGENADISYDHSLKQGGANGYYRLDTKQICLRSNMAALQTLKTIIHEKAHSLLHNSDSKNKYTREEAEVQAESVAYVVCQTFGLNSSEYSFGYIAGWSNGKELKELRSSLAVIEKTAKELIQWLSLWLATETDLDMVEPA